MITFEDPLRDKRFKRWNELFDLIRRGAIEPEEGERLAAAEELDPLHDIPDPKEFDPFRDPRPTMLMVVAWAVYRSEDKVRDQMAEFRAASHFWASEQYPMLAGSDGDMTPVYGWRLRQLDPPSIMDMQMDEIYSALVSGEKTDAPKPFGLSVSDALREMWGCASAAHISAMAIDVDTGMVTAIPAGEWSYLEPCSRDQRADLRFRHDGFRPKYRDVRFLWDEIYKRWPKPKTAVANRRSKAQSAKNWLTGVMDASPSIPTLTKAQAEGHARSKFGLSRDAFRVVWEEAIAATNANAWSRAGRRRNNPAAEIKRKK